MPLVVTGICPSPQERDNIFFSHFKKKLFLWIPLLKKIKQTKIFSNAREKKS
jgi:hypothetical protein